MINAASSPASLLHIPYDLLRYNLGDHLGFLVALCLQGSGEGYVLRPGGLYHPGVVRCSLTLLCQGRSYIRQALLVTPHLYLGCSSSTEGERQHKDSSSNGQRHQVQVLPVST